MQLLLLLDLILKPSPSLVAAEHLKQQQIRLQELRWRRQSTPLVVAKKSPKTALTGRGTWMDLIIERVHSDVFSTVIQRA